MRDQLLEFIRELKSGKSIRSLDEAATKQTVILRCLYLLNWNIFDTGEVCPEYSVGPGSVQKRVDYSLKINNTNKVFLEVKKPVEELEKHQEQLSDYFSHEGVKLAVLTNGITWWFYLPLNEGTWEQRKFYSIDISQQVEEDITDKFLDFLAKENIANGKAFENAEIVYKSQQREKILHATLPRAWNSIISKPDDLLVDLINETAESICGYRADNAFIRQFLISYRERFSLPADIPMPLLKLPITRKPPLVPDSYIGKKISSFYFKEQKYRVSSWRGLLMEICKIMNNLHKADFDKVLTLTGRNVLHFSRDKSRIKQPMLIPNTDIFVKTCWNANQIVTFCQRIIALFGYSDKDLEIEIEPD